MDEIDAKLQRISQRIESRAEGVRTELAAIGFLAEAGHLRERFGARLVYLKTPRIEQGDSALMSPGVVGWTEYIPPKTRRGRGLQPTDGAADRGDSLGLS